MPKYEFKLKGGKTLTLEGDTPPTDADIDNISKEQGIEFEADAEPGIPNQEFQLPPDREAIEQVKAMPSILDYNYGESPSSQSFGRQSNIPPEEQSYLERGYHLATDPLIDAPSRLARSISPYIDKPSATADDSYLSGLWARTKGFAAGATEGLGDVISSFTSPASIVTGLGSASGIAAKYGLTGIANALKAAHASEPIRKAATISGMIQAAHGGGEVIDPETSWTEKGRGLLEAAMGFGGMMGVDAPTTPKASRTRLSSRQIPREPSTVPPEPATQTTTPPRPEPADIVNAATRAEAAKRPPVNPQEMLNAELVKRGMDPNFAQGIGDAELAGSTPYQQGAQPAIAESIAQRTPPAIEPEVLPAGTAKIVDWNNKDDRGNVFVHDLNGPGQHGYSDPATAGFIADATRMRTEQIVEGRKPEVQAKRAEEKAKWDETNRNIDIWDARFGEKPTPQEQAIIASKKALDEFSNIEGEKFSEAESKLPEDEYYKRPPEEEAIYQKEYNRLRDAHIANIDAYKQGQTQPAEQPPIRSGGDVAFEGKVSKARGMREFAKREQLKPPALTNIAESVTGGQEPNFEEMFGPTPGELTTKPKGELKPLPGEKLSEYQKRAGIPFSQAERILKRYKAEPEMFGGQETPSEAHEMPTTPPAGKDSISISRDQASPEVIKAAREQGYEFHDIDAQGNFIMKKSGKGPTKQPILETEVGGERLKTPPAPIENRSVLSEAVALPRSMMTSNDLSAPLRQGIGLMHRGEYWKALGPMFKAWWSEGNYRAIQNSIAEKPLFKRRLDSKGNAIPSIAEDAGLHLSDLNKMSKREESMQSRWAEKFPGVRRSNRAYTTFLNKLRADTFESLVQQHQTVVGGKADATLTKALAEVINTSTGRGSLKGLEQSAGALSTALFAPRLIASRVQMLNPHYYWTLPRQAREEAIKSLITVAGMGSVLGQLVQASGAGTIESDPTSSDYGKIKVGNTRIDPYAGFQQYGVAANRLLRGRYTSTSEGRPVYDLSNPRRPFDPSYLDVMTDFAENKANPYLTFALGIARGKGKDGQPFNVPEETVKRFVPIFMADLKHLLTTNPDLIPYYHEEGLGFDELHPGRALMGGVPALFGAGVQHYGNEF